MHRTLKVREVLFYQALLRLPATWLNSQKRAKVAEVLQLLDLVDIQESAIGDEEKRGISGGQRKRVNIGMELVADPTVLFLDEPTSGLDSTSSYTVLKALKRVASEGGLTVVTVLHQPRYEIFCMFDEVLLLGKGGRTVYLGPTTAALGYFQGLGFELPPRINPPDFYMDIIANPEGINLVEEWERKRESVVGEHDGHMAATGVYRKRCSANFLLQTWVFFKREIAMYRRMKMTYAIDITLLLISSYAIGKMNSDPPFTRLLNAHFQAILVFGLLTGLSHLRPFGSTRPVFWRESAAGVNKLSYFVALNLASIPMQLLSTAFFLFVAWTLISPRSSFSNHYEIFLAGSLAISGLAYLISITIHPRNAQLFVTVVTFVSCLLGGFEPSLTTLHEIKVIGPIMTSCSYARWMLEALNQYEAEQLPAVLQPELFGVQTHIGYEIGHPSDRVEVCFAALLGMAVMFRVLAFVALVKCNRGAQQ